MKFLLILFLIITSYNLFSKAPKLENMFFIFSSDTEYNIKSSNSNCLTIDTPFKQAKEVHQKAIYLKLLNSEAL